MKNIVSLFLLLLTYFPVHAQDLPSALNKVFFNLPVSSTAEEIITKDSAIVFEKEQTMVPFHIPTQLTTYTASFDSHPMFPGTESILVISQSKQADTLYGRVSLTLTFHTAEEQYNAYDSLSALLMPCYPRSSTTETVNKKQTTLGRSTTCTYEQGGDPAIEWRYDNRYHKRNIFPVLILYYPVYP